MTSGRAGNGLVGLWWYGDDGPHLGTYCAEQARRVKTVKGHTFRERGVGKTVGSRTSRDVPFGSLQTGSLVGQERGTTVWRSWLNVQSGPSKPSGELAVWRNMVPENITIGAIRDL